MKQAVNIFILVAYIVIQSAMYINLFWLSIQALVSWFNHDQMNLTQAILVGVFFMWTNQILLIVRKLNDL